jgi:hypothetical protein
MNFSNLQSYNKENSQNLLNLWLVSKGTRSGYLRVYKIDDVINDITEIPNINSFTLKRSSDNKLQSILYYNPNIVDILDINLLQRRSCDKALGRVLGYLHPGLHDIDDGYSISYIVNGIPETECEIRLYNEIIPKPFDINIVNTRRETLQQTLKLLHSQLEVSVIISDRYYD